MLVVIHLQKLIQSYKLFFISANLFPIIVLICGVYSYLLIISIMVWKDSIFSNDSFVLSLQTIKLNNSNIKLIAMDKAILKSRSIGSIVNDNFATARVFKSFGLDFCCGGSTALEDACRVAGVDVDVVVEALLADNLSNIGAIPFDSWPTDLLIDYVLKIHHRGIRTNGPRLLNDIRTVARVHGDAHPELLQLEELFEDSLVDLENHLRKEEQVLFPYCYKLFEANLNNESLHQMHCGSVANPIRVMLAEHSDEGTRYKFIRVLMKDFVAPDDACPTYRLMLQDLELFMDSLFEHIHIENNILFPRFVELESCSVK